jgi:hypothetical protein
MSRRKFEKQFYRLENQRKCILAGDADHLFVNAQTKAHFLADIKVQQLALIKAELEANPGLYTQYPDGSWSLFPESDRKVIQLKGRRDGMVTE